jgi:pimeloyl-ACP methyl ester carboxylesterase
MRILATTVLWLAWHLAAAQPQATLPLQDCRLEHPLHLDSIAARCGMLRVAENRSSPAGAQIDLRLAVVPALNRRSTAAPLFVLAGGPGQSAIDLYASFAPAFARSNRNHDIVLLDQRGTGKSAPLNCAYPEDWTDSAATLPQLRTDTLACLAKFGERVRDYTSSVATEDLEEARRALGYPRISLYGASYGTRIAQSYMRRHGEFVDAVILDGVIDPEKPLGPDTPRDGERALEQILARCAEARDCAQAYPRLPVELRALRDRYGPERLALNIADPDTGLPLAVEFSRSTLTETLRLMSYGSTQAALLPTLLHQAALGQLAPLVAQSLMLARQLREQIAIGMQMSVLCSEDVPFYAAARIDRASLAQTYQGMDQIDALQQICELWPRGPVDRDLHARMRSNLPTLLLSGEADPVTPAADATRVATGLTRHRHLILDGEGHGQLATACVPRLIAQFLDVPDPQRLDTSCLAGHRAPPFFVSTTGPSP